MKIDDGFNTDLLDLITFQSMILLTLIKDINPFLVGDILKKSLLLSWHFVSVFDTPEVTKIV